MRLRHNRAHLNLCTSHAMVEELEKHGIHRVRLWPKAVDTSEFHPDFASGEMRAWLSQGAPDQPLFLYAGRLSREKGIEALRPMLEAIPGARLALVGDGPNRERLKAHFVGLPVFFAGYLTGRRLAGAMASVDALILPSKTETLGLVLMEAMAAGAVVIGANAGGIPDVIEHQVNGLLYEPERHSDLTEMARTVLTESPLAEGIRIRARQQAEQWSWAAATQELLGFYEAARHMPRFEKSKRARAPWMLAMKKAAIGGMKLFLS